MGGTLLALYFATVGVVASTAYANAPHRIRLLFVRERSGRFYTKTVALLVAAALIVVGLARVGVTIHALTILVLIAVAVFAVLSLVVLGVTIFNFFDPASLAGTLVADFALWVNAATAGGGRLWEDASFQDYYQRRAAGVLETFEELLELIVSTQRPDYRRVADLAGSAARMQHYYSTRKPRIPTKSRWYPRRYQHPSWLTAADTQRSMALATGTAMQPTEVPDHFWVEDALASVITTALRKLLDDGELRRALGVCNALVSPMRAMGGHLQMEEAVQIWRRIADETWKAILPETPGASNRLERAGLANTYVLLLINIGLGLHDRVENLTATAFADTVDRGLRRAAGIYALDLPVKVLEVLETMDEGICFEREVEGRQITPAWFPRQLAARAAASLIRKAVDLVMQEIPARVAQRAREAADGKEHAVAAAVVQGGLEFCNKTEHQAAGYKRAIEQLTELRQVKDEFWPPDPPDWRSQVSSQERWLVAFLANLAPSLATPSRENDEPDWFGQDYSILVDRLFRALRDGDEELFAYLFPAFFDAAFAARDRIAAELETQDLHVLLAFLTGPLIDLLEISGYALLFSELDGKDFWDKCRAKWDAALDAGPERGVLVQQLAGALDAQANLLLGMLKPRDIERTGRKQQFDQILRSRSITDERWSDPFNERPAPPVHPSPIVRVFAPSDLAGLEDPEDLFTVEYLSKRPEWQFELTRRAESLAEQLQRERGLG